MKILSKREMERLSNIYKKEEEDKKNLPPVFKKSSDKGIPINELYNSAKNAITSRFDQNSILAENVYDVLDYLGYVEGPLSIERQNELEEKEALERGESVDTYEQKLIKSGKKRRLLAPRGYPHKPMPINPLDMESIHQILREIEERKGNGFQVPAQSEPGDPGYIEDKEIEEKV